MIKAVIFDFDGLIIDTESVWYESYRDVFLEESVELPLELWVQCVGTSFAHFDPIEHLQQQTGKTVDRKRIERLAKEHFDRRIVERTLRDGVKDYLNEAKRLGLKIGLASSSRLNWVEPYLQQFGIAHYFDGLRTADHVRNIKPDPELYVETLKLLEVEAAEAVAFEDSLNGLRAAKGAGMHCVIVPNPTTEALPFENYNLRLASMKDMPLAEVILSLK